MVLIVRMKISKKPFSCKHKEKRLPMCMIDLYCKAKIKISKNKSPVHALCQDFFPETKGAPSLVTVAERLPTYEWSVVVQGWEKG